MKYLFLSVPPYSGSTVLHNYITKCAEVSYLRVESRNEFKGLDVLGIIEGNAATSARVHYKEGFEPYCKVTPGKHIREIQNSSNYDWVKIKAAMDKNWGRNQQATVRLQKTPNDTYRVEMMQSVFDAMWIVMVRNPFAWAQSTIEKFLKRGVNPSDRAEDIAMHIVNTYKIQKQNQEFLGDKAYTMTFEDFVANTDKHIAGLKAWMPELDDLTFTGPCRVKEATVDGLADNNAERVALLKTIPGAVKKFEALFAPYKEYIEAWGYSATL